MIALDTNLLVHAHRVDASLHQKALPLVVQLAESAAPWAICFHSLVEFYGVVTQSRIWRQASTPEQAFGQIAAWCESPSLHLLVDSPRSLPLLQEMAIQGRVQGALIHDARIAACCLSQGVRELWTVDRDFSRFPRLKVRQPLA